MRFPVSKVFYSLLIVGCCFFSKPVMYAQSMEKRIALIAEEVFPLLPKEDCVGFIKSAEKGKEIKNLLGTTLKIDFSSSQYVRISSDSTIVDELILLPYRRGDVLCHIRTLRTPELLSFISFYDERGKSLPKEHFILPISGVDFLLPSVDRSSVMFQQIEKILPFLPIHYTFSWGDKSITLYPSYSSIATEEQKVILRQLLQPQPITLKWKKKRFLPES
ncbi:DUF3256 family protein [Porphyromonas circumdentaria]|nr:DUF3256 family protein [Porphyromonas circumdentaria]MBB6275937.1 hypothetical protein [Porphyromonas circumdentaria]